MMWTSRGQSVGPLAIKTLVSSGTRQKMPLSMGRDLGLPSRAFSSVGAGPSTLRARPHLAARHPALATPSTIVHGRRHFSIHSAVSSTFDALQHTLEYPTSFVSHLIDHSPIGSHGATIILLAIFVRTALTLPLTLWQRKQKDKMRSLRPELEAFMRETAKRIVGPYRRQKDERGFNIALQKEVADERRYLFKVHRLHPQLSTWGPIGFNLSILITMSTAVRAAVAGSNSSIAQESFAWISQLGEPDLPVSLTAGIVAFAIAELSGWQSKEQRAVVPSSPEGSQEINKTTSGQSNKPASRTPGRTLPRPPPVSRLRPPPPAPKTRPTKPLGPPRTVLGPSNPAQRSFASSTTPLSPPTPPDKATSVRESRKTSTREDIFHMARPLLFNAMRFAAIGLVMLTSQMPAGVTLYICTSLTYTLGQIFIFRRIDERRERLAAAST